MHPERYWAIDGSIERDIPTGDMYVERGKAPWIAEMYGYSFGAAVAGVDHVVTQGVVMYPRDVLGKHTTPHIIHYGIDFSVGNRYTWNKMSFKKLVRGPVSAPHPPSRRAAHSGLRRAGCLAVPGPLLRRAAQTDLPPRQDRRQGARRLPRRPNLARQTVDILPGPLRWSTL